MLFGGWCCCIPWMQLNAQLPRFQHLLVEHGLSDNAITCLYEDRAGFLWIGTENGLDRYDGNAVRSVDAVREHVVAITEDGGGSVWVATQDHGLHRFDASASHVRSFRHDDADERSIPGGPLSALYDLNDTTLLIGSHDHGLLFLDKRSFAFTYWTDPLSIAPAKASRRPVEPAAWCHAIIPIDDDRLWIGFLNLHTSIIVDVRSGAVLERLTVARAGSETQTTALLLDGVLYTGGWQSGVDVQPLNGGTPSVIPVPDEVLGLVPWSAGRFLAGTRSAGLFIVDPRNGGLTPIHHDRSDPSSLASDRVRTLLLDRSGSLWVGTANGLCRSAPAVWRMREVDLLPPGDRDPQDLLTYRIEAARDGGARVFTSAGLIVVDSACRPIQHWPVVYKDRSMHATVLAEQPGGGHLLGTEYGILHVDPTDGAVLGAFEPTFPDGSKRLAGDMFQVRGLRSDHYKGLPVVVIGSLGFGALVVDANSQAVIGAVPVPDGQKGWSLIGCMERGAAGGYWFGTPAGLFEWDTSTPVQPPGAIAPAQVPGIVPVISNEDVRALLMKRDTLWGVVHDGALFHVVKGAVSWFRPQPALASPMNDLAMDRFGHLWIATNNALLRYEPRGGVFVRFPVNDGSVHRKLTSIACLADGRVAACAGNTLIHFDPADFHHLPPLPQPYITAVFSAGKQLVVRDAKVDLGYNANVIDIGVSALRTDEQGPDLLEYRMEGIEPTWRSTSAREPIRYASLPIGTHRLLVRAVDHHGRTGPELPLLTVEVVAPFWQQWWFYAIGLVLVSAGLFALQRARSVQALRLQRVRDRIARDLHDDIGSTLGSISYYSAAVKQRIEQNDLAAAQEVLDRIGDGSREMIDQMHDIVWSVDPTKDAFSELSERMHLFASGMLGPIGVALSFQEDEALRQLKLTMEQRKGLFLIFKEAVYNAAKHARCQQVRVDLRRTGPGISITIEDDGVGIAAAADRALGGNGTRNMRTRAADLGGSLLVNGRSGGGTSVRVTVPIKPPLPGIGD